MNWKYIFFGFLLVTLLSSEQSMDKYFRESITSNSDEMVFLYLIDFEAGIFWTDDSSRCNL